MGVYLDRDFPTNSSVQKPLPKADSMASDVTLRDYFAAAALQGLCATLPDMIDPKPSEVVKDAYQFADAMIAEREKRDG